MSLDDPTMECFVMEDDHEPKPWFSKAAIHDEYNMMRPIMFVVVCQNNQGFLRCVFFFRRCGAVLLNLTASHRTILPTSKPHRKARYCL